MAFTNIPNGNLQVGAPLRSVDILALRDNVSAVPNGDTGAPRIRAAALLGGSSGAAPIFAARAWVNFDGTSAVSPSIRASGNVSSVDRISTGRYRVNFTTALPDANSCAVVSSSEVFQEGASQAGTEGHAKPTFITTTYVEIRNQFHVVEIASRAYDAQLICVSVFR